MEVAQHFLSFIQGLENSNSNAQHIDPKVDECLSQIKEIVNRLNLNSITSTLSMPLDQEQSLKGEQFLIYDCTKIYTDLKETLSQLCLMHVYVTNFPLHKGNVARFLSIYCQAIFGSSSISIISESPQAPSHLRLLDGESITNEADLNELIQELILSMSHEDMRNLDLSELPHMKNLLKRREYAANVVIRLTKGFAPYYVILHFEQESSFTEYFMVGRHYKAHPLIFNFINHIVDIINTNTFQERKESTLQFIEALTIESIHIKKNFFLSFIASELKEILGCDMPTCIRAEERSHSPGLKKSHSKSVEIVILNNNRFDIHANFEWNNFDFNSQLSGIWGKLQSLSKVQEERNYFRAQIKATTLLCLQFSKEGELVYQSGTIPEECWPFVDMDNILQNPKSRYLPIVFGKNKQLLELVEDTVKGFKESSILSTVHKVAFDGLSLTFICKKNEWSKAVDGFSIVFNDTIISEISNKSIDTMLSDLENLDKLSTIPLRRKISKRRTMIGGRNRTDSSHILGPNVNLDNLRKTIVSEYLPEELTEIPLQSNKSNPKSVSAIRTSNLDITPRSGFRGSFEPDSGERRTSLFLRIPTKANNSKEEFIFTQEVLESDAQDMDMLLDWSLDVSKIEDVDEKSRLVGVMLNDMNLIKEFNIDLGKLSEFVSRIKEKYSHRKNPYHNYDHGISVMHATYNIINKISTQFSSLVNLALLVSAFCHDADHTGRTNMFEVNTSSSLALVYHDRAVLEQHHAAVAFKILNEESCNIFSGIRLEDRKELRKLIISNILATDVKEHFEQMKSFRELSARVKTSHDDFVFSNEDIQVLSGIIIHSADLSGATKDFPVALSWSEKVNQEFSAQVKQEAELGIPVTPYFKDLDKKHIMAKQEVAFISFMVKPLWELFCDFCGGTMQVAMNNIEKNLKEWNTRLEIALKNVEEEENKDKKV